MTRKEIRQIVQDGIAMEKMDIQAARVELYHEFSMHGGDGPWNNYGECEFEQNAGECEPVNEVIDLSPAYF